MSKKYYQLIAKEIAYTTTHKRTTLLLPSNLQEKVQCLPSLLKGEPFCVIVMYTLYSIFGPQRLKGTVTPLNTKVVIIL